MKIREIGKLERDIAQHLQKFSYQQRSLPYCLDYTQLLIALIGKAYANGELELLGEVGRYSLLPPGSRTYGEWALDMHIEEGANDFIALRKEE